MKEQQHQKNATSADKPCMDHRISFPNLECPELIGILKQGHMIKQCPNCGWYLLVRVD